MITKEDKEKIKLELEAERKLREKRERGPWILRALKWLAKTALKTLIFMVISFVIGAIISIIGLLLFYNYFPIKTVNFCLGNETFVSPLECEVDSDCIENVLELMGEGEIAGIGGELVSGFLGTIFNEVGSCNENGFCEIKQIDGLENIMSGEKVECKENEVEKIIKITPKSIIPPEQLKELIKTISESEEARQAISDLLKGEIPELPDFNEVQEEAIMEELINKGIL